MKSSGADLGGVSATHISFTFIRIIENQETQMVLFKEIFNASCIFG